MKLFSTYSLISSRWTRSGMTRFVLELNWRRYGLVFSIGSSPYSTAMFSEESLNPSSENGPMPSLLVLFSSVPVYLPSVSEFPFVWLKLVLCATYCGCRFKLKSGLRFIPSFERGSPWAVMSRSRWLVAYWFWTSLPWAYCESFDITVGVYWLGDPVMVLS